ncbi:hypothetical protein IWZ01DRAFT_478534 [Phyllosticta capitalensis]
MPTAADVITYVDIHHLNSASEFPSKTIIALLQTLCRSLQRKGTWDKKWSGLIYPKQGSLRDRSEDAAWSNLYGSFVFALPQLAPPLSIVFEVFLILYVYLYFIYFLLFVCHKSSLESLHEFEFAAFPRPDPHWPDLTVKRFQLKPPLLLRRPWMELAAKCGFGLVPRMDPYHREESIEQRFDVDLDMRVRDTTPMAMSWKVFVLIALTISVDPLDLRKEDLKFTLKDRHSSNERQSSGLEYISNTSHEPADIMQVETKNGRWDVWIVVGKALHHSVHQALAWSHTMCFSNGDRESPQISYQRLGEIHRRPLLGDRRARFWYDECSSADSLSKLDPKDRMSALTAAITWFFYRGYWSPPNERTLPVTQRLLEIREQSLCYLRALEDEGNLESRILGMLGASTGHDASNAVDFAPKVFSCVQSAIQHSDYVGDWGTFRKILRALQTNRGDQKFSVPRDASRKLERMRDGLGTQVVGLGTQVVLPDSATPRSSTDSTSSELVTTMLQSYDAYNKLKHSFDPHLNQNDEEKTGFPDDFDDMTLLAHILLAVSDWSELPRTHWPLDEKVDVCIRKILDSSFSGDDAKPEDVSAMLPVMEEGLRASEFGIYTSRKSLTVLELLSWNKAPELVYLH